VKLSINIFIETDKEELKSSSEEIGKLITQDLLEALAISGIKITPEKKIINKEEFIELTETNKFQYNNIKTDLAGYSYLMVINIGLFGENLEQIFIEGSFLNTFTGKAYAVFENSYLRGVGEKFDIFLFNSLTDLEMKFSPLTNIIENKELPLRGTLTLEKNELTLPSDEHINCRVSDLLNKEGEDIRDYISDNIKIAVRLNPESYGTINPAVNAEGWSIISPDEKGELNFFYIPPSSEIIPQNVIKEIIEVKPVLYGKIIKEEFDLTGVVTLFKEQSQLPQVTPTPLITTAEDNNLEPPHIISSKDLLVNIGCTHYGYIHPSGTPRDKGEDYSELVILLNNKPLKGASVKIFSLKNSKDPPISQILKDTLEGGVIMKEINDGYYCAGYVPVLGKFPSLTFYPGGTIIVIIRYGDNILGIKSFPVPSFSIKVPEQGKLYSVDVKLKAILSTDGNDKTIYTWQNYKIDKNKKRLGFNLPLTKQPAISITFQPSTLNGKETDNILKIKADIHGATDILSPDGYWVYTISNIQEVWYRVTPSGKKPFLKFPFLKNEIKVNSLRSRTFHLK